MHRDDQILMARKYVKFLEDVVQDMTKFMEVGLEGDVHDAIEGLRNLISDSVSDSDISFLRTSLEEYADEEQEWDFIREMTSERVMHKKSVLQ